ncbi:MAG: hypothetical protein HY455_02700 [Parcubacteria group bacterium]|nr:hypothetical protein [Parcubacteria group bacterium]
MSARPVLKRGAGAAEENLAIVYRHLYEKATAAGDGRTLFRAYLHVPNNWRHYIDKAAACQWLKPVFEFRGRGKSIESIHFIKRPEEIVTPLTAVASPPTPTPPSGAGVRAERKFRIFRRDGKPLPKEGGESETGASSPATPLLPRATKSAPAAVVPATARAKHAAEWGKIVAHGAGVSPADKTPPVRKMRPRVLVFVDAANLTGRRRGGESEALIAKNRKFSGERVEPITGPAAKERLVELRDVDWAGLMHRVCLGPSGNEPLSLAGGWAYVYSSPRLVKNFAAQKNMRGSAARGSFQIIFHEKSDTDPLMAADIVYHSVRQMGEMVEGEELILALITGDIDFLHAINRVKELAGLINIRVRPWILSWETALSAQWKKHSEVTFLDGLPVVTYEAKKRMQIFGSSPTDSSGQLAQTL